MIDSIERKSDRSDICRAGRGNGCWSELCPSHTCPTNPFCSHAGYRRPLSDTRLWDYDPGDRDTRRQTIEHDECVSPSFLGHSITLEPPSCPSRSVAERNLCFAFDRLLEVRKKLDQTGFLFFALLAMYTSTTCRDMHISHTCRMISHGF